MNDTVGIAVSQPVAVDSEKEAEWRQRERSREIALREERYRKLCPPLYQHTDPARLPQDKHRQLSQWKYGPKGLALVGPTGTSKTRCAWQLLRRVILEGRTVRPFDGIGWGMAVSAAFGTPSETEQWLDRVCKVDVLFIDDLFKAKMTEAQELAAYGVFERRASMMLPIIVTMNSTGQMILDRMTDQGRADRGEPLIRRIREFCDVISF